MKKTLLSLTIVTFAVFTINAQQLQNAGFETWTQSGNQFTGYTYKPANWNGLELSIGIPLPIGTDALTRSTTHHNGEYSLNIAASAINPTLVALAGATGLELPDSLLNFPIPGLATNGTINVLGLIGGIGALLSGSLDVDAIVELAEYISNGLTVNAKPYTITGFAKPAIQNAGDACMVSAIVFSTDGDSGSRHAIGAGATTFLTSANEFQPFSAPITYFSPNENASELIVILISLSTTQTIAYTSFLVDDLTVDYTPTAVNEPKTTGAKIYHNKADNTLNIFPENTGDTYSFELYNILGKRVIVKSNLVGNQRFNVSALSAGCYIVKTGGTTKKIIIR
ncbi:MAG: T9SS type A sorting domain-containing protein [Paludibacter sp.]|jgi:hypothetical protein|nr:T9SS type A sorting domain-containing protein [Paludibacter sp.]